MLIDRTHRKWMVVVLAVLVLATLVYVPYQRASPAGPSGGSALGLTYGIAGSALMLFAGLLGARKKVPVWRIGRAQTWMRGHLWLGALSFLLILFHGGFAFGGLLTTVLMWLFIFVLASGVAGAALQHFLPRLMTAQVPMETIYDEVDSVRVQLREEADQLVAAICGPLSAESSEPQSGSGSGGAAAATVEVEEEARARLREFYLRDVRPFLERPEREEPPLGDPKQARRFFQQLDTLLPAALPETVADLENICEEERQLNRQARLHEWLHG
ncbi:MAG: hypothetical protein ACE5HB_11055, partial [Terriglobia bacterium]